MLSKRDKYSIVSKVDKTVPYLCNSITEKQSTMWKVFVLVGFLCLIIDAIQVDGKFKC